jgi:hypothetical protein
VQEEGEKKKEPTHFSQLDPKTLKVSAIFLTFALSPLFLSATDAVQYVVFGCWFYN